jgi:hypothetical protein
MDIAEKNRLRAEAKLPLLDVAAEIARLEKAEAKAEFEREWDRRRPEFADWISSGEGWMAKMGRWSLAAARWCRRPPVEPRPAGRG